MRLVAFLRAINVGGQHLVAMEELRKQFSTLGFADVATFIASGNVIFNTRSASGSALEKKIETRLLKALGYEVKTFIRTEPQIAAIARYTPFTPAQLKTAAAVNVGFLAAPLSAAARKSLRSLTSALDDFHVHEREVYWLARVRQSESKVSNGVIERTVGAPITFRGVNTVTRLVAKYGFGGNG
jgi:uncharacterized protein (DUF1697 family)